MQRPGARSSWRRVALAGVGALALAASVQAEARAGGAPACPSSTPAPYTMDVSALTGPARTDVALHVAASDGCAPVTAAKHVQLKTFGDDGKLDEVVNLDDIEATDGVVPVALDRVDRGRRIEVEALVHTGTPQRTYVLRAATTSRLRPDLAVTAVHAPPQTLTTRHVAVTVDIAEVNGDTGATAQVTLGGLIAPLADPVTLTIEPGGQASVTFPNVALTLPVPTELTVLVTGAAPDEYDSAEPTNDRRTTTVDVTTDELNRARLVLESLGGYGFQFNGHVYAPITSPPPDTLPNLEAKVKALEPQLVRIFFNENWELNADGTHPEWEQNLESFKKTIDLAQESGATILVAYQGIARARLNPALWMTRYADVLQDVVQNRGDTNVRWVTIGNEPNSGGVTFPQYEAMYRTLDAQLIARGLRSQIGLVGGDLVENGQRAWFDYMTTHMNDVLDAWSEHIYWRYDDTRRMEERLKDVSHLVQQELPAEARKPTFLMEYGVRGFDTCGAKPKVTAAYYGDEACTELRRMPLAGFQKFWFLVNAAQLGFDGASNWDLYWSVYDRTKNNQSYWTIGPPEEGWALYPSYYALQLLLQTTARGWHILGVDPWAADDEAESIVQQATNPPSWQWDQPEEELTAFLGPEGQMTVAGLDTNGGALVAPNGESSSYSIGGLPPNTPFTLALWNATGDGTNSIGGTVTTNAAGVARFDVPLQAAFVLTTVPVS
jgi:hypothetical protein